MTMLALLQRLTSPPTQTLHTLKSTESAARYTVSTRPARTTLPAILSYYVGVFARVLIGLIVIAFGWLQWRLTFGQSSEFLSRILGHDREAKLIDIVERGDWRYCAPGALVILFLVLKRDYIEESLTVLRGLGIQTSTSSPTYLLGPTTRFIPTTSVQDILIHEAFKGFEVKFYLAVVVEGESDVVVVFPKLLPRRAILETVWRGSRACLWDSKRPVNQKGKQISGGSIRHKPDT